MTARAAHENGGATAAAHAERLAALEKGHGEVKGDIGALSAKVDERGRPQWQVIAAFIAVASGLYYFNANQASDQFREITNRLDRDLVSRGEHEAVGREQDALRQGIVQRVVRLEELSAGTYSVRDALLELRDQNRRLQEKVDALSTERGHGGGN